MVHNQYSHLLKSDYLCQCSRFIWKDVLNLSKLFVQGCGFCLRWCIRFLVIHFNVPVDHQALYKPDTFHTINKRNFHYEWFHRSRYFILWRFFWLMNDHNDSYLTYRDIGTTVFRTMAYEKKTNREITVAPPSLSFGISISHSRYF